MKLRIKLALFNAIIKAIIILAIGLLLPRLINDVVYDHVDQRLQARSEKLMSMVKKGGIREILLDEDCSFDSHSIFKEEYVSISPLPTIPKDFGKFKIENASRNIDGEILRHRVMSHSFLYDNQLYQLEIGEGISSVTELNETIWRFTLGILIIVIVLSVIIDLAYVQVLLRPFYAIVNRKLQGIQHPNTFNKAPINTQTFEFKYLDDSINEMMQKVQDAFQLERDFIMNVSHELLTPISILQNKIENCMSDGQMDDETAMKLVEMQKTLLRLTKVVKALLYISKIDNEQFLKNEIVDLKLSVAEVLLELEDKIEQKNLTITMDWEIEALLLHESNKTLIHTLFFNIISNALKYNVRDGKINITAHKQDDFIVVTVKDTGCGIEEKNLSQIFERFKRFRPDDENSYGIGLPIVKKIATFLNLELKVASQLGVGTIFSIYFSSKLLKLKG